MARRLNLLVLLALFVPAAAHGNDSTGFQSTTGIELTTTDAIRMVSEDLRIGLDEVRVDYVFHNVTVAPVETLVAFPLPDLDLSQGDTAPNWNFPVMGDDFLGFRLWIDGVELSPELEQRAFLQGRDVTAEVAGAGALSMAPWRRENYDELVAALAPGAADRLRRAGLLAEGEYDDTPQWTLRSKYWWRQSFPAGRDLAVRHVYKPFVGLALIERASTVDGRAPVGRMVGTDGTQGGQAADGQGAAGDRYCLDDRTRRGLAAAEAREPGNPMPFMAAEVEYVLTTARNWRGPIERFRMTLDKGAPDNILSLCWDGLRKTGPTTFESVKQDFLPDRDIRLLVFVKQEAAR